MENKEFQILQSLLQVPLTDISISNPEKNEERSRIRIRPILIQGQLRYQAEEFTKTQVFHTNLTGQELLDYLVSCFTGRFRQGLLRTESETAQILVGKSGKVTILRKKTENRPVPSLPLTHNRSKTYLLPEGTPVPFLVELGVMSADGHVRKEKYDKFRQINRFLEFVADILPSLPTDHPLTILDFGCGKSYLTFALYYFLKVLHSYELRIIGLDLKKDVIEHCNRLAKQFGYQELTFLCGDVADYDGVSSVDMVVTLHACDTATDYALARAVQWNASVILSVPCCQHELNRQIAHSDLTPLFRYGIVKERTAALFTDALRANLLEAHGYQAQLLEFIELEHTPKNLLIRAVRKSGQIRPEHLRETEAVLHSLHAKPTLYRLLFQD